jgi:molybdate transport system ATP-binding protein
MIEFKDVSLSLRGHLLFDRITFELQSGVSYLVEGKNGSGKTTLLKLMAGLIQPGKGTIHYNFINDELDWEQKYELRKKYVHYIPGVALHELLSTPDLYYQQRYYSIGSPMPTVRDYFGERCKNLDTMNLPDSFNTYRLLDLELPRLSNGQVKKVIILKQLLDTIPRVLLLDYPFEGLDVKSRTELSDFLHYLVDAHQIQLIIADHEQGQLPNLITKKILIEDSDVLLADREVIAPMNFIRHTVNPLKKVTEPVVEMLNITIRYGNKVIVEKLTWTISRGERWALTGPNGSGKTTLFSLIYADHPMAYSENVSLFGKRRGSGESIWDIKKRISYLGPEQLHFLDYVTEQLTVSEYLGQVQPSDNRVKQIVEQFEISSLLTTRLRLLSQGQLQLVLLLSLFLSQKELLLLDEPFQFLDPVQKARVNEYLQSHLEESTTLILITHYDEDVVKWTHHRLAL